MTSCEFADFVRANTPSLLRTAYLLTGSAGAAEELVQDTLVRLYPKWHRVAAADFPLSYVRRALSNSFINQRRRPASSEILFDELPEHVTPGSSERSRFDDRDHLGRLLQQLPERQRAAIVLRFYDDLPDDEIAAALHARPGTVRSLISRGLTTLRALEASAAEETYHD